jgi:polyphosphate kinase
VAPLSLLQPDPDGFHLDDPRLFINRDLSLLDFNRRVLAQAEDVDVPLLERLRFLTISGTNLDEFFEVRAASHKERVAYGSTTQTSDGRTSGEALEVIADQAQELVRAQYATLNEIILPALREEGVRLLDRSEWTPDQARWLARHFQDMILPVLTPVGLDPSHPFPRILNKALSFLVQVKGKDAYGRTSGLAVLQVPRTLLRLIQIPVEYSGGEHDYVLLCSVIHAHIDQLFAGMEVLGCYQFRVTRNGDLWVDEEEVENLLQALQGELPERQFAEPVRLEVVEECPRDITDFLLRNFGLGPADLFRVRGPVNLGRLSALHEQVDRPDLKFTPITPRIPLLLRGTDDLFENLRQNDVLLHHPFESFQPVVDLVRQAACDPDVLAIKQTLYRTGNRSQLVDALIDAARAGKQVTVIVELRARFDEERNIDLATQLSDVGANVVYGIVGYKTHAKLLMIVRREGQSLRRYCHVGTGNYHAGTARAYTDFGFLTSDSEIGEDIHRMFQQLTGLGAEQQLSHLLQSPFTLYDQLLVMIEREIEHARAGRSGAIIAKMNALTEVQVIRALYRASQAGVKVDLVVRGACCLRPGIPGVSDNIHVRSTLGRFLEHSRLCWFRNGGDSQIFLSSADWMSRNLHRRVESALRVDDPGIAERLLREGLLTYLAGDMRTWELQPSGQSERSTEREGRPWFDPQVELLHHITGLHDDQGQLQRLQSGALGSQVTFGQGVSSEPPRREA